MTRNDVPQKRICWVTADYFLDCDIEIIRSLSQYYQITWHIILPGKNSRYNEAEIMQWRNPNFEIVIHNNNYRLRDPKGLLFFFKLTSTIRKTKYDILYLNYTPSPFFTIATITRLKKQNVVVTAHQGQVHAGFKFQWIYSLTYKQFYSRFRIANMFSESEAAKFMKNFPGNKVFFTPLALKNFGECIAKQNDSEIGFFNFGTIRHSKNIALLIKAACSLYEDGVRNFRVSIAGECDNWEPYKELIRYPEIFTLDIRMIGNNEIKELFCRGHYLVLPYDIVTQSGPLKIAYYYNIPVIASNLPGFSNEIINDKTGFLFEPGDEQDLKRTMLKAINTHQSNYQQMRKELAHMVEKEYSFTSIRDKYLYMFNSIGRI
jgi:glycosyltransferase involved in cell wall biosynthesis